MHVKFSEPIGWSCALTQTFFRISKKLWLHSWQPSKSHNQSVIVGRGKLKYFYSEKRNRSIVSLEQKNVPSWPNNMTLFTVAILGKPVSHAVYQSLCIKYNQSEKNDILLGNENIW